MARPAPPNRGRRLRLAAAGVAPVQTAAPETNRPGPNTASTRSGDTTSPGSPFPGLVLDRGRYTTIDGPGRTVTDAWGINDRGEIVIPDLGTGLTPVPIPQPPATPRGRMA